MAKVQFNGHPQRVQVVTGREANGCMAHNQQAQRRPVSHSGTPKFGVPRTLMAWVGLGRSLRGRGE